ncbi:PDZ domain-containing protein [Anoxybacillus sp. J5B_2022]|uniref:PDZ domain-containing protein n=1 Tax=Anoxybacillus sp. J5B_2022 TaxID=3003246 RepID=UPI002286156F|nr:PDZ domain-containing protein [Anoxybacillus sp. J5B_2022]MCZ0754381.1 PDZ domain-containing protein [Anoxybacillus sp. J5B_2022]
MASEWIRELLTGIGRGLLQPLLYYGILLAAFVGWRRVKRERRSFHIRVYDWFHESKFFWRSGLGVGLLLSLLTVVVGVVVPPDGGLLLFYVTALLGLTLQMRLLSPAYTLGLTMLAVAVFTKYEKTKPFFSVYFPKLQETNGASFAVLLALLLLAEAWLILRNGAEGTSPQLAKSKRGLVVGEHWTERLWLVPVLLPIPDGSISSPFWWWPLFPAGDGSYSFLLVPFLLGFSQRVQGMHPHTSIQLAGQRVLRLAVVVGALAVASYWYHSLVIVAAAVSLFGREWIAFWQHTQDQAQPPYFAKRAHGLVILGILPDSKAEKMALKIGEIIVRVNGTPVKTEEEFYEALQHNRAYCKLEVLDENGEIRFVQGALYEDEHHELGLLFVRDREKWTSEAV